MKLSFKTQFALLVGLQLMLLMGLVASKYATILTGTTVMLATAPVDPRDLFRGDYVTLRYKISALDLHNLDSHLGKTRLKHGAPTYVVLSPQSRGNGLKPWHAVAIYPHYPTDSELENYDLQSVVLQGRVESHRNNRVELEYGIESYFVPEGKGRDLERKPELTVEAKIDRKGRAVLRRLWLNGKPVA